LDGLNLELSAPFNFKDAIVGFKYHLGTNLKKGPESFFGKYSVAAGEAGKIAFDGTFKVASKTVDVASTWVNDKIGLDIGVKASSAEPYFKNVAFATRQTINGVKWTLDSAYDHVKKSISGNTGVSYNNGNVNVAFDSENRDPRVTVSYDVDEKNTIAPSYALKSGDASYAWTRKLSGGSVSTTLFPNEKVSVNWRDEGSNGVWSTKADIPLDTNNGAGTKVSFSRDWKV
jgi:hypothetical protein